MKSTTPLGEKQLFQNLGSEAPRKHQVIFPNEVPSSTYLWGRKESLFETLELILFPQWVLQMAEDSSTHQ